jgi:hypothetical protein
MNTIRDWGTRRFLRRIFLHFRPRWRLKPFSAGVLWPSSLVPASRSCKRALGAPHLGRNHGYREANRLLAD